MKAYIVVFERDGKTTKEPGKTSTEVIREERFYAAESFERVWESLKGLRDNPEYELISINEVFPSITILG